MFDKNFEFINVAPPISEFINLRAQCGWGVISRETATKTLDAGIASTTVYAGDNVAGFGRVIGDGAIYFYVQDLIVNPQYRGSGLGTAIMKQLIGRVREIAMPGASLGLMSAINKEEFYEQLGFISRPNQHYGAGMTLILE